MKIKTIILICIGLLVPLATQGFALDWAQGGTGRVSFDNGDLIYFSSSSDKFLSIATGTDGWVLTMSGNLPVWAASAGGGGGSGAFTTTTESGVIVIYPTEVTADWILSSGATGTAEVWYDNSANLLTMTGDLKVANATATNSFNVNNNFYIDSTGNLVVDGTATFNSDLTSKRLIQAPVATQSITAVTDTIADDSSMNEISSDADYVMTSTPTIATGTDGQILFLKNTGTFTIDFQDVGVVPGTAIYHAGGGGVLSPGGIMSLIYLDSTPGWSIQSHPNTQAGGDATILDVRNVSGSTIGSGVPVYAVGWNAGQARTTVAPADADDSTKMPAIGVVAASISNNANGQIITTGELSNIDTSGFSVGNSLYVDTTVGQFTATRPSADDIQKVAEVLRAHSSFGVILIQGAGRTNDVSWNADFTNTTTTNATATDLSVSGNLTLPANSVIDAYIPDTITIDLATAATALNANPTDCAANTFADAIAASGNLTCNAIADADVGALTVFYTTGGQLNVTSTQMASDDFGEFACDGTDQGCTLDDSVAVTSWNLTTPTITSGLTFADVDISPNAAGELVYDNTVAGFLDGVLAWYDDDAIKYLADFATLPGDAQDDYVLAYDKDLDGLYFKVDASGGSTAWDDIGNPDANDEIDFAAYVIELNVENFQIGDGGANFVDFNGTPLISFQGNADIVLPALSVDAGTYAAASIDGDDVNSNIAGRSLVLTSASPDTLDADAELYAYEQCKYIEDPVAADDLTSLFRPTIAITVTEIWAESDQTVNFDLQEDDGSPADIIGLDLIPAAGENSTTTFTDAAIAADSEIDLVVTSVSGTPTWISICIYGTYDD